MLLKEYIDKKGTRPCFLAKVLGMSTTHLYRLFEKDADIWFSQAKKLEEFTEMKLDIKEGYLILIKRDQQNQQPQKCKSGNTHC